MKSLIKGIVLFFSIPFIVGIFYIFLIVFQAGQASKENINDAKLKALITANQKFAKENDLLLKENANIFDSYELVKEELDQTKASVEQYLGLISEYKSQIDNQTKQLEEQGSQLDVLTKQNQGLVEKNQVLTSQTESNTVKINNLNNANAKLQEKAAQTDLANQRALLLGILWLLTIVFMLGWWIVKRKSRHSINLDPTNIITLRDRINQGRFASEQVKFRINNLAAIQAFPARINFSNYGQEVEKLYLTITLVSRKKTQRHPQCSYDDTRKAAEVEIQLNESQLLNASDYQFVRLIEAGILIAVNQLHSFPALANYDVDGLQSDIETLFAETHYNKTSSKAKEEPHENSLKKETQVVSFLQKAS